MFGSYDEAIVRLRKLYNDLMAFDSPYFDYAQEAKGVLRAIEVLEDAWRKEKERFSKFYESQNLDDQQVNHG